ncbi:PP2C family protein-serine/threonine phosphatase [Streptomyces sp. NPDC001156]
MPHHLSGGSTVEVATRYLAADTYCGVGGDWFDVIELSDARVALVVGDVVGHGIDAAVTMGRLSATTRALSQLEVPPDELLRLMDELAVSITRDRPDDDTSTPSAIGATCLYGVYHPKTRRCTMSSAGHPPPAIISPEGSVDFAEVPPGAPIGVGLGSYESTEVELPDNSVIGLYLKAFEQLCGMAVYGTSSIGMPRVIRANVSLLSERAKQSDDEANKAPNALWWPASSAVAEAAVSF